MDVKMKELIKSMAREGIPVKEIAERAGCGISTAYAISKEDRHKAKKKKTEGITKPTPETQKKPEISKFHTSYDQSRYHISHY